MPRKVTVHSGDIFTTKSSGKIEVILYNSAKDVTCRFIDTGAIKITTARDLRLGVIKDVFAPSISGVGVVGNTINKKEDGSKLKSFTEWKSMLTRCYSKKFHEDYPTYVGCWVDKTWTVYANFKDWFETNYIEGFDLDKDILVEGNKCYSEKTCVFVPRHINNLSHDNSSRRGKYALGVSYCLPRNKFRVCIKKYGEPYSLGRFSTEALAKDAYNTARSQYVCEALTYHLKEGNISKTVHDILEERLLRKLN